jgi:hypothetical protein
MEVTGQKFENIMSEMRVEISSGKSHVKKRSSRENEKRMQILISFSSSARRVKETLFVRQNIVYRKKIAKRYSKYSFVKAHKRTIMSIHYKAEYLEKNISNKGKYEIR